ncbi:MAG: N-acetylneuraminate synthase family protein [Geminicoccaceae bacterium]
MTFRSHIEIAGRKIGPGEPVYIIAEIGLAHLGSLDLALLAAEWAAKAGADALKTQAFNPSNAEWLYSGPRKWWRMLPSIFELKHHCEKLGLHLLVTPHDEWALSNVVRGWDLPAVKIGSGERGNWDFIRHCAEWRRPMIVSLGGYSRRDTLKLVNTIEASGNDQLALLHCVSKYPIMNDEDLKLDEIDRLAMRHSGPVGYSCHWNPMKRPEAVAHNAVIMGANIIERHIGPVIDPSVDSSNDLRVATYLRNFRWYVEAIRKAEKCHASVS